MNQPSKILIVDDELSICQIIRKILTTNGYLTEEANSGKDALKLFSENNFDLIVLDLMLLDMDGLEVATKMISLKPHVPVVLISAYANVPRAVEATKKGVYDFLEKPLDRDRILVTVRNALAQGKLEQELERYKYDSISRYQMVGQSPAIKQVYSTIEQVAPSDSPVLILGENGTGKELVALAIHNGSKRAAKQMIKINCAAIPDDLLESEMFGHTKGAFTGAHLAKKGRIQMADGGTLFLDEIGDMSASAQAKLLRFLESGEIQRVGSTETSIVNVRVITASNKNLPQLAREQKFREDLYFRLNVVQIRVPPLRERSSDIPLLLDFFINEISEKKGYIKSHLSPSAKRYLSSQQWHGNIRQLRNFVERLMLMNQGELADLGTVKYLLEEHANKPPQSVNSDQKSLTDARNEFEREYVINILEENDWRVSKAAEMLGVDRANLYRKMKQLGISL